MADADPGNPRERGAPAGLEPRESAAVKVLAPLAAVLGIAAIGYAGASQAGARLVVGAILPACCGVMFVVGIAWRVLAWAKSPVPFRVPLTAGQQHPGRGQDGQCIPEEPQGAGQSGADLQAPDDRADARLAAREVLGRDRQAEGRHPQSGLVGRGCGYPRRHHRRRSGDKPARRTAR